MNRNSILDTVKNRLNVQADDTSFDGELIMIINGELSKLAQIGVGPNDGVEIFDNSTEWSELIGNNKRLNFVKDYVAISVKLIWDYPSSGSYAKSLEDRRAEYEWRLNFEVDPFNLDKTPQQDDSTMSGSDVEDVKDAFDVNSDDPQSGNLTDDEMDEVKDSFDIGG